MGCTAEIKQSDTVSQISEKLPHENAAVLQKWRIEWKRQLQKAKRENLKICRSL